MPEKGSSNRPKDGPMSRVQGPMSVYRIALIFIQDDGHISRAKTQTLDIGLWTGFVTLPRLPVSSWVREANVSLYYYV